MNLRRLLIVDDDLGSRESLRQTFSRLYQVHAVESAAAALKVLNERRVDVVLLDVMMPEKDGVTFLRELQDLYPDMPCVMVSASAAVRPVVEAMRAGAYDFVIKPFANEALLNDVANAYDREVNLALTRMTAMLEPLMIIAMGGSVGFIVFSIMQPIMMLNEMAGQQ